MEKATINIAGVEYDVEINEGKMYFGGYDPGKFFDEILTSGQKKRLESVGFAINRLRNKVYNITK